jgi:hypothetical protein
VIAVAEAGSALAVRETVDLAPRMVTSLSDMREGLRQLEEFKRDIMIEGVDYGTIPGTPKPTLLKPGAEKLTLAFGLAPSFEHANRIEDWERGFFHYEERCTITSRRTGEVVATANGSANSKEPRYRWRNTGGSCPDCGHNVKRRRDGGAWCPRDDGGCGRNFSADSAPKAQRVENPEPWELTNTILKMAQKRALVAAALIATGGSGIWTQDIEDMPSITGDARVVDVMPQPPSPSEDAAPSEPAEAPAAGNGRRTLLRSADDPMWQRWLELKAKSESLGIPAENIVLPVGRPLLQAAGIALRKAIAERLAQLQSEDDARADGAAERESRAVPGDVDTATGEVLVDHGPAPDRAQLWAENRRLGDRARELGLHGVPVLVNTAADDVLLEANRALSERIVNLELDQELAAEKPKKGTVH